MLGAAVLVCALAGWPRRAGAADVAPSPTADFVSREIRDMSRRLEAAIGAANKASIAAVAARRVIP